ncbi:hypothetical protein [Burkholderia pseudomallei]|uniref:hypothetical protein n=1 Tax=Burkholderia pseudomallei TaxID=28450 RepID=UPI00190FDBA7|nr:hypothetical protein [Burkholderia pseudomallei]
MSIHMNDGRRIEFAGALALSHFVASRAMHLESLLLAFADDRQRARSGRHAA